MSSLPLFVQEVYPNSPAEMAGLQPRTDYIVGTPEILFNDSEDFFTLINSNIGKPVPLYVFSINTDNIRLVRSLISFFHCF
jgi:S1-C subfamily serine protease